MSDREPCPWRIVDDAGGAFAFGLAGGTIYHFIGGARNAPRGHMLSQAIMRVKARTPILGGSFAIWGTLFSCCDCSLASIRRKEDPWNAIMSGFATGGILAARAGPKAALSNAFMGGIILAGIEGLNVMVGRVLMPYLEKKGNESQGIVIDRLEPPKDPLHPYTAPTHIDMGQSSSSPLTVGIGGLTVGGKPADDFDFTTGRYKSEVLSEASEQAVNAADAAKIAEEDKKKGWW
jgi:mitochondrial import inner membrane translocase subunit TIM17